MCTCSPKRQTLAYVLRLPRGHPHKKSAALGWGSANLSTFFFCCCCCSGVMDECVVCLGKSASMSGWTERTTGGALCARPTSFLPPPLCQQVVVASIPTTTTTSVAATMPTTTIVGAVTPAGDGCEGQEGGVGEQPTTTTLATMPSDSKPRTMSGGKRLPLLASETFIILHRG